MEDARSQGRRIAGRVYGTDDAALDHTGSCGALACRQRQPASTAGFTRDAKAIEIDWRVREGLLGIVGKLRPEGTAVINEDVCFPTARIAAGAHDCRHS